MSEQATKTVPTEAEETYTFTEAPASVNIRFMLDGFDTMLTIRANTGRAALARMTNAIVHLKSIGAVPKYGGNGGNNNQQGQGKVCPIHHTPMTRREKHGDVWHSHKAVNPETNAEYWCRGGAEKAG